MQSSKFIHCFQITISIAIWIYFQIKNAPNLTQFLSFMLQ